MTKHKFTLTAVLLATLLASCATPVKRAEEYAAQDEWMKAVLEYRKAYAKHPDDVEYKSRLKQTELKAADFYYQRGVHLLEQDNIDGAIVQFQQGLAAMPEHSKLMQIMNEALARKEAGSLYQEGLTYRDAGKPEDARRQFQKALNIYPDHKQARAALAEIQKEAEGKEIERLALTSKAPITLNFRQTDLRAAFEFIAKSFGINVIFDEGFKSTPVTLYAKDVTFEQGLNLLLTTTRTFYKRIGPNTILVAPDTKDKRGQYEDHMMRTYNLNTVRAKEMADILRGVITIKKIIVNEQLNTLVIRDTEEVHRLVERMVDLNDKKPAEIILEVEIMEVSRKKAEKLGLDFGSYEVKASVPAYPLTSSFSSVKGTGTLTVPSVILRFFKQDVDAKTLANPKIRVLNGKAAKIHIGDRVPLRASTITDATGQVRTTYDYKDIGIRLNVEPNINLDNSTTVKLGLEVSSLGDNIGTAGEPAYSIGTRNAETYMLLRDGETAILGGLIRDEERNTRVKIPGLGDIPVVGAIFTSYDDSTERKDVLLTITPRVVRSWDVPARSAREFYSGSENTYADKPLFAHMEAAAVTAGAPVKPKIELGGAVGVAPAAAPYVPPPAPPILMFSEAVYEAASGQEFEIRLTGQNLSGITALPVEIMFNPQLLGFVRGERGDPAPQSFGVEPDEAKGTLKINLAYAATAAPKETGVLARLFMRGLKPGISYLVYRVPAIKNAEGATIDAQVRASRIVIK